MKLKSFRKCFKDEEKNYWDCLCPVIIGLLFSSLTGCSDFGENIAFENALEKQNAGDYLGEISYYTRQ